MNPFSCACRFIGPALLLVSGVIAQTRSAALVGDITDEMGAVIAGASVKVTNLSTGWRSSALSDGKGHYDLANILPGIYQITVSSQGMRTQLIDNQELFVGTTTTHNFTLGVGMIVEQVTATASAALLESTKSDLGQVIVGKEVDSLPVLTRDFSSLALLTPNVQIDAANGGLAIGGQRGFANNFIIDGVTNRDLNVGTQAISYSQDWIAEFRVATTGYGAEFGQASGGIINVVTRSGGNDLHGRGYGYFQRDPFNATPAFTKIKPAVALYRPGGYLSGPVKHERIFFFGGYEYLNSGSGATVTSPLEVCAPPATRDSATRNCSVPTGNTQNLYFLKGDWHLNTRNVVSQRFSRQSTSSFNSGVGGINTVEHGTFSSNKYWSYAAAWTSIFGSATENEVRGIINRKFPFSGSNAGNVFEIQRPSGNLGSPVGHGAIASDWIQFVDNFSLVRSNHSFKIGGDFDKVRLYGNFRNFRDGRYIFNTDQPFNISDPATYPLLFIIITGKNTWDYRANNGGLFAQDSWRVTSSITLNYGIRWDTDNSLSISGTDRVQNVSPRFGLAWAIDRSGRTVWRLSGGLYSDAEHTNQAGIFILNTLLADKSVILQYSQGPVNNPFYNPADPVGSAAKMALLLAQAFARNTVPDVSALPGNVSGTNGVDKKFKTPYTRHALTGVSRLITSDLSISADLIYEQSRHLLVYRDENITPQGTRPDPRFAGELNAAGIGDGHYRAVAIRADYRHPGIAGGLAYTYSKCDDNTSTTITGGNATSPFNIELDRGPCDNDIRHTFVGRGSARLPFAFDFSSILTYRGAPPYSATKSPQPLFTRYALRNGLRATSFQSWDARLARPVKIERRISATFLMEAFNLLNHRNFTSFVGNVNSALFGKPQSATAPRQLQLGLRVDF